jgi:hypothetical protein
MATADRDEVQLRIDASPELLYDLVSDAPRMGRWSPECTGGRWLGRADGPAVGARFLGTNRRGWLRWATVNTVVAAEPGREFAFETKQSGTRWGYRFEPDGDGTLVTEWREPFRDRPLAARLTARFLLGGVDEHDDEMRDGMRRTLERIRDAAET